MPGFNSLLQKGSAYVSQAGKLGAKSFMGMNAVGRGTVIGGAAGAAYGAMSDDTSVLGGMAMGAGMGRLGAAGYKGMMSRYNSAAGMIASGAYRGAAGTLGSAFGRGVTGQVRSDFGMARAAAMRGYAGARMATNKAGNTIRGLWSNNK